MDPISGVASVIAIVQLSGQILGLCQTYYVAVRDARKDIKRLQTELSTLNDALVDISDLAETAAQDQKSVLSALSPGSEFLNSCCTDLGELLDKLQKNQGAGEMSKFGLRALKWPLSTKDVAKHMTVIERQKSTISIVLEKATLSATLKSHNQITELKQETEILSANFSKLLQQNLSKGIQTWLSAPDPSVNLETARAPCLPGTGKWLLDNDIFVRWSDGKLGDLWISGPPGCGKTAYASSIIANILQRNLRQPEIGIAYFFFDFKDDTKQKGDMCVRTLIQQLVEQCREKQPALDGLYSECSNGLRQPDIRALVEVLCKICSNFKRAYIVIDGLDESTDPDVFFLVLETVKQWNRGTVHFLVTSQPMRRIEESFSLIDHDRIRVEADSVNIDIRNFVSRFLQDDIRLRAWPRDVHEEIETTIMLKANGMFRWVVYQLTALQQCLNLQSIRRTLKNLPSTLHDTYDRILSNLSHMDQEDVRYVLEWLAYSSRPLELDELNAAFATTTHDKPRFDPARLLPRPRDFLLLCSSLAEIKAVREAEIKRTSGLDVARWTRDQDRASRTIDVVQLSHSSVKDYLLSKRIKDGPFSMFSLEAETSNLRLAKACLTYLIGWPQHAGALGYGPCADSQSTAQRRRRFPLLDYASRFWAIHAENTDVWDETLEALIMRLMDPVVTPVFRAWIQMLLFNSYSASIVDIDSINPTPLYFAASFGVTRVIKKLLDMGVDVNQRGGTFRGTPLHAAFWRGHNKAANILLEYGADTNILDDNGYYA